MRISRNIKLHSKYIEGIYNVSQAKELFYYLQNAIELEHATIPTYLTAMYSLKPGTNKEIREIIYSIVMEEMLHMTIAANILNALGGSPAINFPKFVPAYPGPLPMGIGSEDGLIVTLSKYSKEQVKDVFMVIEEPEKPLDTYANDPTFSTIGEFYTALEEAIKYLYPDNAKLPGNPERQVTMDIFPKTQAFFPEDELFPILRTDDAVRAIEIIKEQGEGTPTSPETIGLKDEVELAHYYKFWELFEGRRLVKKNGEWGFTGKIIPFNPDGVYPLYPDTKACMLKEQSYERKRVNEFNASYQSLLNGLHETFNGKPEKLKDAIGLMFDVKLYGEKLCATPFPKKEGYHIGPSFEYVELPFSPPTT